MYGRSDIERIAPIQQELNEAYNPDAIKAAQARFNALPWYRKLWIRWKYR